MREYYGLIERLRAELAGQEIGAVWNLCEEAADAIEYLQRGAEADRINREVDEVMREGAERTIEELEARVRDAEGPIKAEDVPAVIEALRAAKDLIKVCGLSGNYSAAYNDAAAFFDDLPPYIKEMVDA